MLEENRFADLFPALEFIADFEPETFTEELHEIVRRRRRNDNARQAAGYRSQG